MMLLPSISNSLKESRRFCRNHKFICLIWSRRKDIGSRSGDDPFTQLRQFSRKCIHRSRLPSRSNNGNKRREWKVNKLGEFCHWYSSIEGVLGTADRNEHR